ncbi:hypothetical protein ACVWXM_007405 [Bradyrhizobium sp. GM7.3]
MTNESEAWRRPFDIHDAQRLGPAIRIKHMGLATCDDDKIAPGDLDFLSLFEREGR